jgi:predicted phosphodiesterase
MLIGFISDTHTKHKQIDFKDNYPDVLIHAGDASNTRDTFLNRIELLQFLEWYHDLPIPYKIFCAGNHDVFAERHRHEFKEIIKVDYPSIIYLEDEEYILETPKGNLKLFASPKTPSFGQGWAFNVNRSRLPNFWDKAIPEDLDILITHGPPRGILDRTGNENVGCSGLLNTIIERKPKICVFGHLHDEERIYNNGVFNTPKIKTTFINASIVDLYHRVVNEPIYINYDRRK